MGGLAGLGAAVIALYARMVDRDRSKLKPRPHVLYDVTRRGLLAGAAGSRPGWF